MIAKERRYQIIEMVNNNGSVSIEELINKFAVSRMTLWRDLKILEERGILVKVHGGAIRIDKIDSQEEDLKIRQESASSKKKSIAKYATENYINDSDIIFLDGGTTVAEMIPFLNQKNLTVLTNGLNTLVLASRSLPNLSVIGCGGILRKPSYTFVGPEAQEFFSRYFVDKAFISGTGLTIEDGIMDPHPLEMEIKKIMCNNAKCVIVLMDSSKFNKRSLSTLLNIDQINVLITDDKAPSDFIKILKNKEVIVKIVSD